MKYIIPIFIIFLIGCTPNATQDNIKWEKINSSAEKLFIKAVDFKKSGQLDSAIIYIYKADDKQPNHPYILHERALIGSSDNEYLGSALIDMDKSIKLTRDVKLKKIRFNDRGRIFYKMGELDRALNDWVRAGEFGEENLKKYGSFYNNNSIKKKPQKYYSLDEYSSSVLVSKFPKGAFDNNGGLLKGTHIIFTQKANAGSLYDLFTNSKVILIPVDSSIYLKKLNENTFDLYIPKEYSKGIVSYDVYIAPNRGYSLVTYFSNKIISYPDTLHLHLINLPVGKI